MKIALNFPKDSEGIFDSSLKGKFGGATVRIYELAEELSKRKNISVMLLYPEAKDKPFLINTTSFITFALKDSYEEMSCNIRKFSDQFHIRRNVDEILELIKV